MNALCAVAGSEDNKRAEAPFKKVQYMHLPKQQSLLSEVRYIVAQAETRVIFLEYKMC